ncbi:NUDIX hydrolase [Skermanella stibiiresistens SB22]|uniref:NUDIX hydrolase n=1 Tax=Skermanella stibiiresistens SB22 TaxID=1385369 RepID=W9H4K5_9PROT|nr:CoA pyrophosphatase [Skermanella stibiiresistens]EWY41155.1 NUDIX hydrolase [Skermanella stibiiresistens SB22]
MEHGHILSTGASNEPGDGDLTAGEPPAGENSIGAPVTGELTRERIRDAIPRFASTPGRTLNIRGDHDLNPGTGAPAKLREAAVLVPLVDRPGGMTIIFTQRTAHLAAHAGQISFPGGGREPDDADALACALRETSEEIGLAPEHVEVAGRLDTYVTRTGFEITPIVGFVRPPFTLRPDPYEVAEVFEVPLAFFLKPGAARKETRQFQGTQRYFYVFPYEHRYIWGATAGMLVNLVDVLRERC